jgi:hypothetical protein
MRRLAIAAALLGLSGPALADTKFSNDLSVSGQLGVSNFAPQATFDVRMSSADQYGIRVSSQNGTALMTLDGNGRLAIGVSSPMARFDINGAADSGDTALLLRVGNSSSTTSSSQIVFAYGSSETYRHSIRTRHVAGQDLYNTMDFFLWRSTAEPTVMGSVQALSLQAVTDASTQGVHNVSVHVMPAGTPDVELEVSDGITTGAGTINRAAAGTHSSRAVKTDIAYLDQAEAVRALEDVKGLQHSRFRYKRLVHDRRGKQRLIADPSQPVIRGIVYEEAPASIQGPAKTVVLDYRVLNLELASQELDRRIKKLEAEVGAIKAARRR